MEAAKQDKQFTQKSFIYKNESLYLLTLKKPLNEQKLNDH